MRCNCLTKAESRPLFSVCNILESHPGICIIQYIFKCVYKRTNACLMYIHISFHTNAHNETHVNPISEANIRSLLQPFFDFFNVDTFFLVGSFMFCQDTQQWPQLQPPLAARNPAIPVCRQFEVHNRLELVGSLLQAQ